MSLHFAAGAVTAFHWSLLSDHIGRKAVLLTTIAGTAISVILFGFARSFWAILFRCLLKESSQPRDLLTVALFVAAAVCMAH
jgi:MFS family permease